MEIEKEKERKQEGGWGEWRIGKALPSITGL
jgi:hypothetical protein